ncbi:phenoloxidase-activating enzyme-like isoform X2 [Leguminivora glycinivorella]|uniref:phenoloxidase-activating enzyme-like isoform X2 n=1 Tax=Leguminivora glycinivorella TaxID=1035111 RepID=UPI00200D12C3|nr:phenoloxidase-activating enzyme-like isoform X2 [Leguminivora glycinivorella]
MLLLFIVACGVDFLNAQCGDSLSEATCISIENCETLRPLITKRKKTADEFAFLRKQTCGFDGAIPKICCPKNLECVTPNGVNGQCIDIRNCSNFVNLINSNPTAHDIKFIQKSRCYGPESYSVCCTPPPPRKPIHATNQIDDVSEQCPATALPPGPETGCCGTNEGFNKISGGGNANIDQFPWLVLIEYRRNDKIVTNCGGALISGNYVLTAAHCVDTGNTLTSVRLGEYDTNNSGPDCVLVEGGGHDCTYGAVSIPVNRIIKHPFYRGAPDYWNDIAILRLARMTS